MERRIATLERAFGGGRNWDDDELWREVRRAAVEHGLDEAELYAESMRILRFAEEHGVTLDSWAFVETWCQETGEDINAFAFQTADLRRRPTEER